METTENKDTVKEILNPSDMTVRFNFVESNDMTKDVIPDFLRIPVGEEADLLRPLGANTQEPQAATTRSALKNKARCAFKTARRPLNFSGARKTPEDRRKRKTPESGRKLAKSNSETNMRKVVKVPEYPRPRTAEPKKQSALLPSEKRRLAELAEQTNGRKRKSEGGDENTSPDQPIKKPKVRIITYVHYINQF